MTDLYSNLRCCVGRAKFRTLLVIQKGVDVVDREGTGEDCPERVVLL